MNRKLLLRALLQEEEDDDMRLLAYFQSRKRTEVKRMYQTRRTEGYSRILITNHLVDNEETYRQFFRLNKEQVHFVLNVIGKDLEKKSYARVQKPISPEDKLLLTLRFLATGESYKSLSFAFRISPGYISVIVRAVLEHMCDKLTALFMPQPSIAGFETIANDFLVKWNFPNCVGAIDGKHIRIQCPRNSGSLYFNYKNFFSIVLLALVDANYKFIVIDVGSYEKEGGSGIFNKSIMGQAIREGKMKFPRDKLLPGSNVSTPHVIVGDEAFRLSKHMLKPYPKNLATQDMSKQIFNYRLCRARRVSENAFGILSQTFRIFYTPIAVLPETSDNIITATCCLHNMLRDEYVSNNPAKQHNFEPSQGTTNMVPLVGVGGFGDAEGFVIRNRFRNYFTSPEGAVEWQQDSVERGVRT